MKIIKKNYDVFCWFDIRLCTHMQNLLIYAILLFEILLIKSEIKQFEKLCLISKFISRMNRNFASESNIFNENFSIREGNLKLGILVLIKETIKKKQNKIVSICLFVVKIRK